MSHKIEIQEGAIFVSDAHYCKEHPAFFAFLKALDAGKVQTPQLILMGDMFELLFGGIKRTQKANEEEIALLNRLAEKIEIIYFEGNHDFGLKKVFPEIRVYPLEEQPVKAGFFEQTILLSHGDTKTPIGYQVYTKIIRNPFVMFFLQYMNILCLGCIIKWLDKRGSKKDPCYKIGNFEEIINRRLGYLRSENLDIVVEGHFHQDISFDLHGFHYINLGAFACNKACFIVQSSSKQFFLKRFYFKESA